MSRIININNPSTIRSRNRRSIAEILRRLIQKPELDDEAKDMAAMLVFLLKEIYAGVEQSATAWEKRDYWMKAERFMRDWKWSIEMAADIDDVIRHEAWDLLPELLLMLVPHFEDIKIKKMTRKASLWRGAYGRLLEQPPLEHDWQ